MKKSIKVILVFLGVAVLITGAYFLEGYLNSDIVTGKGKITPFKAMSNKVENLWGLKTGWDAELYNSLINEVDDEAQMNNISRKQRRQLIESVNDQALLVIEHAFDSLMSSPLCNHEQVVRNYEGVELISKFDDIRGDKKQLFKDDSRVKALQTMYNDYSVTRSFATRSFAVDAVLEGTSWKSFVPYYKSGWDKKRSDCENGRYFQSHFSKINVVRKGWDAYAGKVVESEKTYYRSMAGLIQSYVESQSRSLRADFNGLDVRYDNLMARYRSLQERIRSEESEIEADGQSSQNPARVRLDELKRDMAGLEKDMTALKNEISSLVSSYKEYQRKCVDMQSRLASEAGALNLSEISATDKALAAVITNRDEVRMLEKMSNEIPV